MNDSHASIDKAENGYVLYLRQKPESKDDWDNDKTHIYSTLDEVIGKIVEYFN